MSQDLSLCPACRAEVLVQEFLCLSTGDPITKVRCPDCRKSWATMVDFLRAHEHERETQALPRQVCPACGNDVEPDELWISLGRGAVICPDCCQCPGCGGIMFRREADRVVCEVCGSNWHDSLEFAHDFLQKDQFLQ